MKGDTCLDPRVSQKLTTTSLLFKSLNSIQLPLWGFTTCPKNEYRSNEKRESGNKQISKPIEKALRGPMDQ